MMGRSYEETVQILIRSLKSAESQMRIEIMVTMEKVCSGMGTAISNVHKDIYKATRHCLTDRVMAVRVAAAKCLIEMARHSTFLYTTELESLATLCFRAFDGSNYEVRCAVALLLGNLIGKKRKIGFWFLIKLISNLISLSAATQQEQKAGPMVIKAPPPTIKSASLDEALGVLMSGFLRGGVSFLKGTGEMIKGSSGVNREVRVGVTHVSDLIIFPMGM